MSMSPPVNLNPSTSFNYRGWTLFEAIDALIAHDQGAVDSGVADDGMRRTVREHLESIEDDEFRATCAEYVRKYYLDERAVSQGYGLKEVKGFIEWLAGLGIDV